MKLLLDTHCLLWTLESVDKRQELGVLAQAYIQKAQIVYVSSISLTEVRIKQMIGKLKVGPRLTALITESGYIPLDYGFKAGDALTEFPELLRHDPFDRMLLAQAKAEGLFLMTADRTLLALGLNFMIDARQ